MCSGFSLLHEKIVGTHMTLCLGYVGKHVETQSRETLSTTAHLVMIN